MMKKLIFLILLIFCNISHSGEGQIFGIYRYSSAWDKRGPSAKSEAEIGRFKSVMIPLLSGDEKKAKAAYGRAHRFLPGEIQFAFDLRFKNFQHALEALENGDFSQQEKDFWKNLLSQKPDKLIDSLCKEIKNIKEFPPSDYIEKSLVESSWGPELIDIFIELVPDYIKSSSRGLDQELSKIPCGQLKCKPLGDKDRENYLKDEFFDRVRNAQRRDSAIIAAAGKNFSKILGSKLEVSAVYLERLSWAVRNTPILEQNHFMRRVRGIAKDMRSNNLFDRIIGSRIVDDESDVQFAKRLRYWSSQKPIIAVVNNFESGLAKCELPEVPAFKGFPKEN